MPSVSFGTFSKRRNSTKQPSSLPDSRNVKLKASTSYDAPTFILTGNDFENNYAKWGNRYYFISDVTSLHNNLCEVTCVLDPLATYKADILSSIQYVSYSSQLGSVWLPDMRIPVLKNSSASKKTVATGILSRIGCYILSTVGKDRSYTYMIYNETDLGRIMDSILRWDDGDVSDILDLIDFSDPTDVGKMGEGLATVMARTSLMGNAYEAAPSCLRSCIWVPFDYALAPVIDNKEIFLGMYPTGVYGNAISCKNPVTRTVNVAIPWHFSDWRRSTCEEVYLYLPLVGMVQLSADSLTHISSLSITSSVTYSDGCVSYEVIAGNEIIGTYGGQASANYPLGIAQQASAGSIVQTAFQGAQKTVAAGIDAAKAASSLNPVTAAVGGAGGAINTAMTGIDAAYQTANAALTTNVSCVGGIGGGAGIGLDTQITCYTVKHDTIINPSEMAATMGLPTMKPMHLSNLSGYCQCVNAHVECAAQANELDAIDYYLNTGFFIE